MKALTICVLTIALAAGATACGEKDRLEIPEGSDVTLQKRDGVVVSGRLVEVKPERVVVELRDGKRTEVPRTEIASLKTASVAAAKDASAESSGAPASSGQAARANGNAATGGDAKAKDESETSSAPMYREVTIPAGTALPLELKSGVASDTSKVEEPVRAALRRAVRIDGVEALPAGTAVLGHVTAAERAARVKGRAQIAFRFTEVDLPGDGGRHEIRTDVVSRVAAATKKQDAAKIGAGAAGGAIIGGIVGGGDGAAKGAAIGGAAGTGVVLSTRGKEVRLGPGADLSVRLAAPLTVRVPVK
jgi:hypothetical protein